MARKREDWSQEPMSKRRRGF